MTDQTSPPPDNPNIMPGVRDYEVHLPFKRPAGALGEDARVVPVRLPAANEEDARFAAKVIAFRIESASREGWQVDDETAITITDVDDTQSPADVAAERDHWKRIVAGLAAKLPMALTLTGQEYHDADPAGLHAVPLGADGMMFATADVLAALKEAGDIANEPLLLAAHEQLVPRAGMNLPQIEALIDGQWQYVISMSGDGAQPGHVAVAARRPGVDHQWYQVPDDVPLPVRNVQPARHGGYEDPDVRRARARNLRQIKDAAPEMSLEMLVHGAWLRMGRAELAPSEDGGEVHVHYWMGDCPDMKKWVAFHPAELVTIRPYTVEAYGSDLNAEWWTRQVLMSDGWWTIDTTERAGVAASAVKVRLSKGAETRTTSIADDDAVLLRQSPAAGAWW